ncbi:cell division cycle 7-related protein kinase-like [Neocloeon triangulifer]|uniref:cell division cycle 7-related protein kinase-like n=1 Tax=Neocloeon triangulifer TaxID=2078957 RepID=UPI00286F8D81|nr:cell division cycle 7-related protein kinase-like [Neocloeon triangulifer]
MEVLPFHHRLRYQIAAAAVSSILYRDQDKDDAIDLSFKTLSANTTLADTSIALESSLLETSFSKARSFHKLEFSSPSKKDGSSSCDDEDVAASQIKILLPDLAKHFELQCKVGEGTFASVYLATAKKNSDMKFAIKHVTPTCHPSRIKKEMQALKDIGGTDNVCGILSCVRNKGNVAFILPYIRHDKFQDYILDMDASEARLYIKNLLIALRRVHQFNVIHRDVKPGNFLYDRQLKKFLLVDFGLAQWLKPSETVEVKKPPNTLPETALENGRKRKADIENALSPQKKIACIPSGRVVLQAHNNEKNIIPNKKPESKTTGPLFQMLAPSQLPKLSTQTISNPNKTSFVRVKNSQVKMLNAPMPSSSSINKAAAPIKPKCPCFKKSQLCEICLSRTKKLVAPRAGTPGFRPPEVLLKSIQQTPAVDIWAAGVMFLSILSGSYPFFRSPDDMTALSEITTMFGTKVISEVAMKLDRVFVCDKSCPPLDLQKLCTTLRTNRLNAKADSMHSKTSSVLCRVCSPSMTTQSIEVPCFCPSGNNSKKEEFPAEAFDLLTKMLDPNPATRITAELALQHPFLTSD